MTEQEIFERATTIIVEQLALDPEEVTPQADFVNDLNADSLDTLELLIAFEDAFEIDIPDEDAEKVRTVADAIAYVQTRKAVA